MIYHEETMNLLDMPQGWTIAHCISADFALGAGVAKQIDQVYGMRDMVRKQYSDFDYDVWGPSCLRCLNVYNLVTKAKYWHKPTLDSLREALQDMRQCVEEDGVTKLAMPKIGCGLDKLDWDDVSPMIKEIFADTNIEIQVCCL